MTTRGPLPSIVLSLSGHDPTGGAGIQADIEAIGATGCRACTVITALTVQDTSNVYAVQPQSPDAFLAQGRALIRDLPVAAVKIGLLGSAGIARSVAALLDTLGGAVPVVLDPVLAAGGGTDLASEQLIETVRAELLPRAVLVTPNVPEASRLGGGATEAENAERLRLLGCPNVLITGTHAPTDDVVNRLYSATGRRDYRWPRLPHGYHGSGCTLAAAVAGHLAQGHAMESAVELAQRFTWQALRAGWHPGGGQHLPRRDPPGR
ncbi:bifunctional hydroxymethylpyrimidine kinase/phosphomethylpyrimidine kinase [Methylococcus geothermalis]|uniref:hydroxymethylpyrimidine kinase n=1 Tax=Methylococcus geothermalis TaxID=2681310 RepID=A0A858QB07_9GAMM|nr:hydroxymethylpyrimidine/phosphomethylpyrimidine kinase [Methylococcus geothermalis]QJD31122.1 hydroxymethylpyrimidine/phosphomethylpyrimidine kinase [Methylococcus geothermalis]